MVPLSVYIAEISPNEEFYVFGTIVTSLGWTAGGGWCGFLGYLLLEQVGWRWFVLLTSVPLFLPPILAFQFFLPETLVPVTDGDNEIVEESGPGQVTTTKKAIVSRIIKLTVFNTLRGFPYYGSILLVPGILKRDNFKNDRGSQCNAIFGAQFLTISLLFGVCHFVGKAFGYLTHRIKVPVPINFTISSTFTIVSLVVMLQYDENIILQIICLTVIQTVISTCVVEVIILADNAYFFTPAFLPISCGLRKVSDLINGIAGNAVSELLPYSLVLKLYITAAVGMLISSVTFFVKD